MTHMTTICQVRLPRFANSPAKVCRICISSLPWVMGGRAK